jgi:hypothetical protein
MKISSDDAFLILHKWQVERTPVVLVGSLMPSHPLRGLITVVTREGIWASGDETPSIWGFTLSGQGTNFLASKFDQFEYLQPAELPSDIQVSLPGIREEREEHEERAVLALTKTMTLVPVTLAAGDPLAAVEETMFLVEDAPSRST